MAQPVFAVDPQMVDETGRPWAMLSEASPPSAVTLGAILLVGHPGDLLLARVIEIVVEGADQVVYLDVFGPVAAIERAIHAA